MLYYKFSDEIHSYQKFIRDNIKLIGNLIIISEQLHVENISKNYIDMLALDLDEKRLVILELKNDITNDNVLGQSIRYYDLLTRGKEDLLYLMNKAKLNFDIDINIDEISLKPKVLLIVPDFKLQLLRSLTYVKDIDIEIIKFNTIQKNDYFEIIKEKFIPSLYSNEIKTKITTKFTKNWNFDEYLKNGISQEKIIIAKHLINFLKCEFLKHNKELETFFYKDKISLLAGKKIWGHIVIKQNLQPGLELSIKINPKKNFNSNLLMFEGLILNYKISSNSIKIRFNNIPTQFLLNLI